MALSLSPTCHSVPPGAMQISAFEEQALFLLTG